MSRHHSSNKKRRDCDTVLAPQQRVVFVQQTNLVSDQPSKARFTDPLLANAWGLAHDPCGPWVVADNHSGVATIYDGEGQKQSPFVVTIPPPAGSAPGTTSAPTGVVFNPWSRHFTFASALTGRTGAAKFLFATEDGTIAAWNPCVDPTRATLVVDRSSTGAVYKGITVAKNRCGEARIYATNFFAGVVDVFDTRFTLVTSFTDPALAATCPLPNQCFAPFGIRAFDDVLYVTFALQNPEHKDDVHGASNGFVDIFYPDGTLRQRLVSGGALNSPWGLEIAPKKFGAFASALLVGNFGDGHISAYDRRSGQFLGQLADLTGAPLVIDGLWALSIGGGGCSGSTNSLYFAAGPDDETHGLFGFLRAVNTSKLCPC